MIFRRELEPDNVATVIEGVSRYTVLFRNNDCRLKPIMISLICVLSPLPLHARQSLTFDRGLGFVSWRELARDLGTQVRFCDSQAPWQKPTVENTNRRVTRWPPRDTILLALPAGELNDFARRLNATSRKCIGFRTPAEVFGAQSAEVNARQQG